VVGDRCTCGSEARCLKDDLRVIDSGGEGVVRCRHRLGGATPRTFCIGRLLERRSIKGYGEGSGRLGLRPIAPAEASSYFILPQKRATRSNVLSHDPGRPEASQLALRRISALHAIGTLGAGGERCAH